jgi:hypothetical protein
MIVSHLVTGTRGRSAADPPPFLKSVSAYSDWSLSPKDPRTDARARLLLRVQRAVAVNVEFGEPANIGIVRKNSSLEIEPSRFLSIIAAVARAFSWTRAAADASRSSVKAGAAQSKPPAIVMNAIALRQQIIASPRMGDPINLRSTKLKYLFI